MNISKEAIEAVKQSNDILTVIGSKVKLKKKGRNYVGLCPFHKEKTPSFTVDPAKQLWNCFGCPPNGKGSTGGDVIGFIIKYDKISFKEAIERLTVNSSQLPVKAKKQEAEEKLKSITPNLQKLLKRVIDFYHKTFTEDDRGLKYLTEERKITDKNIFQAFKTGFANGTLLNAIPDEGQVIEDLQTLGVLTEKKKELFYQCATFPIFNNNGEPVGIYGRRIKDGSVNHLYLPGGHKGVFNWQAVRSHKEIILTESIIDCLTLYDRGFKNVIPCYGTNGLTDHHLNLLKTEQVKAVYVAFDGDKPGKKATPAIAEMLKDNGITPYLLTLPDNLDINDYFKQNRPEDFEKLLKAADPETEQRSTVAVKTEEREYKRTEDGFVIGYGNRKYRIMGVQKNRTQLKATIKAIREIEGKEQFHIDTIDFYSARSRLFFLKSLLNLFGEDESIINDDLNRLLERMQENGKEKAEKEEKKITISAKEELEAMEFLKSPDIFNEILTDFEAIGYTGEETNKLVTYLAAVSRKLDNPLSVMIQSRSAAGKSSLQDAVLSLIPEEDFLKYTRITDQALFYKEENSLVHKILAIEEAEGMGGAAYSIRNIQSSKSLTIASTGKDPATGKQCTEEHRVNGPVGILLSTTRMDIDEETASRFVCISIDESREMTERIHRMQREEAGLKGLLRNKKRDRVIRKHHNAQRMLKPLAIVNPYNDYLTYPSDTLVTRRDHKKYLSLIEVIAFIHQYQREKKSVVDDGETIEYIEVTLDDIEKANRIANEVLGRSLDELSPQARNLLLLIHNMAEERRKKNKKEKSYTFRRREIREFTGWSDWQIKYHIRELVEMEYLYSEVGSKGKEYIYELNYSGQGQDGERFFNGLTTVEEIKKRLSVDSYQ